MKMECSKVMRMSIVMVMEIFLFDAIIKYINVY